VDARPDAGATHARMFAHAHHFIGQLVLLAVHGAADRLHLAANLVLDLTKLCCHVRCRAAAVATTALLQRGSTDRAAHGLVVHGGRAKAEGQAWPRLLGDAASEAISWPSLGVAPPFTVADVSSEGAKLPSPRSITPPTGLQPQVTLLRVALKAQGQVVVCMGRR